MGYPTHVQRIKRKNSEQWYITFPSAVAQAMEFAPSELVEWIIENRSQLVLNRLDPPPPAVAWSPDFRLFEEARVQPDALFRVARQAVETQLPPGAPFVALMDDTLFRKRGRHIAGTAWRRDPLGPPFQTNLVWGQRFLQLAAARRGRQGPSPARAIPIDFRHCPSP